MKGAKGWMSRRRKSTVESRESKVGSRESKVRSRESSRRLSSVVFDSRLSTLDCRLRSLQPLIHPADDVPETLHAVPRLARTGQLVGLPREADHDGRNLPVLQGAEHH